MVRIIKRNLLNSVVGFVIIKLILNFVIGVGNIAKTENLFVINVKERLGLKYVINVVGFTRNLKSYVLHAKERLGLKYVIGVENSTKITLPYV